MTQPEPSFSTKSRLFTEADSCTLGVSVSIFEDTTYVPVDDPFTVYLWIDEALCFFDSYEAVIAWDTTFVVLDPNMPAEEESLMTDVCGDTWWLLRFYINEEWEPVIIPGTNPSRIFISHVAWCDGDSLAGPGALSSLNFIARQEGETSINFEFIEFYLAGVPVVPIVSQDGIVRIGASDVGNDIFTPAKDIELQIYPNPGTHPSTIRFQVPRDSGVGLDLYDASGRRVAAILTKQRFTAGWHVLDRRPADIIGDLPQGIYFLKLTTETGTTARKITVVK
jgi:hypothetical protein